MDYADFKNYAQNQATSRLQWDLYNSLKDYITEEQIKQFYVISPFTQEYEDIKLFFFLNNGVHIVKINSKKKVNLKFLKYKHIKTQELELPENPSSYALKLTLTFLDEPESIILDSYSDVNDAWREKCYVALKNILELINNDSVN